ncbi:MAG TPA: ABC transporter substrate-binding protein [Acidimicrobiia bacterium]
MLVSFRPSARRSLIPLLALALAGTAACGSSTSEHAAGVGGGAGGVVPTVARTVPPGTTLRVGDQLDSLQLVLRTAGLANTTAYKQQYATFVGGPSMLQAFHAGALDLGFVADTPLIIAQAAHQNVVGVAAWATRNDLQEPITAPGVHITSWKQLKGKRVAYQQGTSLEAVLLTGLHSAGLSLHDIKSVNVPVTQVASVLESHSADAGILVPPLDSPYLAKHTDAHVVDRPNDITLRVSFLVASSAALANPAKAAAIGEYVSRLVRAYKWIDAHRDVWVQKFYVQQYGLTTAQGEKLAAEAGGASFLQLPGPLLGPQKTLIGLYAAAGEIPGTLDAAQEFDSRYNATVREAAR